MVFAHPLKPLISVNSLFGHNGMKQTVNWLAYIMLKMCISRQYLCPNVGMSMCVVFFCRLVLKITGMIQHDHRSYLIPHDIKVWIKTGMLQRVGYECVFDNVLLVGYWWVFT